MIIIRHIIELELRLNLSWKVVLKFWNEFYNHRGKECADFIFPGPERTSSRHNLTGPNFDHGHLNLRFERNHNSQPKTNPKCPY